MLEIRTTIKPSPIHGLGCFAEEDIPIHTVVWKFDPRFDRLLTEEEINVMSTVKQEYIRTYGYKDKIQFIGYTVLESGNDRFINHSKEPNLITFKLNEELVQIAARNIKKGEELTCNYEEFDEPLPN